MDYTSSTMRTWHGMSKSVKTLNVVAFSDHRPGHILYPVSPWPSKGTLQTLNSPPRVRKAAVGACPFSIQEQLICGGNSTSRKNLERKQRLQIAIFRSYLTLRLSERVEKLSCKSYAGWCLVDKSFVTQRAAAPQWKTLLSTRRFQHSWQEALLSQNKTSDFSKSKKNRVLLFWPGFVLWQVIFLMIL